jgi:hypothetical protein
VDGEDVDELTDVDEVNEETLDVEENALKYGDVLTALTVDAAGMVAVHILGQSEESIPSEEYFPWWDPDRVREVVTWSCSYSELVA